MTSKKDLTWLQQGVCCWVDQEDKIDENKQSEKQENIFQRAKVIRLDLENNVIDAEFESDKTVYEVSLDKVYECNKNEEITYEDMVDMEILNEPEILQNIKKHYKKDKIFTKIGPTLIVMNPYKYIPELFNDEIFEQIRSDSQKQNFDMSQSIPHVWSIAANSYYSLFEEDKNQAIVISGESGAGKTENTKQAMKFLTSLSENKNLFILDENEANQESSIEEKILRCNPILEAFGNAKTVQNDNSSRFGKYVRIWIDRTSKKIQGASINKYLLEKTRITTVAAGERNYHIFYHMIKGKSQEELNKYHLSNDPSMYKYLDSDCVNVAGVRDKELYEQVQASFNKLNFQKHEQEAIYSIVAAVVLLGNIDFDDSQYSDTNPCAISNQEIIKQIAELLQVDGETLVKCLTLKIRYIGKQTIESPLSKIDCQVQRNSFSKALYDKLFEWLVSKLNLDIQPERQSQDYLSLGLLDIFGFENFKVNSFEQICINFTNEKLQQLFIEYVFKSEKKEFISEGLEDKLGNLVFKDNQHIIDLIDYKGTGLFDLLDESCALANNNDSQLLAKIQKTHEKSEALKQEKLKSVKTFTVKHTAKDVEYCIDGFRQKNLDEIVQSQQDLISNTQNNNILNIWKNQIEGVQYEETESQQGPAKRKNKSDKYLGAKFRNQMNELMGELQSCGVHFIRCLKPNELKTKGVFIQNFVMQQVRYLGLLESVKIRKEGYPLRMQYQHFYEKYREIDAKYRNIPYKIMQENLEQLKVACQDILNSSFSGNNQLQNLENDVLYGNSKIYMRFEASQILGEALQKWWKEKQIHLKKIQKQARVYIFRKQVITKLKSIKEIIQKYNKLQALYKGFKQRKQYKKLQGSKRLYISVETKHQALMKNVFNSLIDSLKEKIFQLELQMKEKQEQERLIKEQKEKEEQERQIKEQKEREEQERLAKEKQQKEEQLRIQKEKEELNKKQQQQEEELKNKQNQEEEIKKEAQPQLQNQEKKQIQQTQEQEQNNQQNILSSYISQSQIISHEYKKQENGLQQTWLNCQEPRDSGKIQQAQNQIENGKQLKIEDIYMAAYKNGLNSQQSTHIQQGKSAITSKSVYQSNIEQYNDPDEATELSNFEENFIQTVEKNDFLSYCDQIIVRGANFSKSHKIDKIMTFQKNALKEPLTRCSDYAREADILFRCILKIGGNRRSRFPLSFQQNNCLSLCMGYDSLDGQEEYTVYNSQLMNTHRYANQSQNLAQKYNQNVLVPSDKGEINPQQVILRLLNGVINDKWIVLRDELYLSLCKQIQGNSSDGQKKLIKFFIVCINMFSPSFELSIKILNFILNKIKIEKNSDVQKDLLYIFCKLSKIYQSYNFLQGMNFVSSQTIVQASRIFKNDILDQQLSSTTYGKPISFEIFQYHLSNIKSREMIPLKDEQKIIQEKKKIQICVHLYTANSNDFIKVPCNSMITVQQFKNQVVSLIGLEDIQKYFGLYYIKVKDYDEVYKEGYLQEDEKIIDVITAHKSEELYYFQKKQVVSIKIYLKQRVSYPFDQNDIESIYYQYYQYLNEFKNGKYPCKVSELVDLCALQLYIEHGTNTSLVKNIIQKNCQSILPENEKSDLISSDLLQQRIYNHYKQLEFDNKFQAQYHFLNLLSKFEKFQGADFSGKGYSVLQTKEGYAKSRAPVVCTINIKPKQIIVEDKQMNIINIIELKDISSWGRSQGGAVHYMYIKLNNGNLYIYQLHDLNNPDYLLNIYKNYKQEQILLNQFNSSYLEVIQFLINDNQNQEQKSQ